MIPAAVVRACNQLGWELTGQSAIHPEGVVYFCKNGDGTIEPYTEAAILHEQRCFQQCCRAGLQAAGIPARLAALVAGRLRIAWEVLTCHI